MKYNKQFRADFVESFIEQVDKTANKSNFSIKYPIRLRGKVNFSRGSALDQLKKFQKMKITEANVEYPGAEKSGVVIRKVGDKFRISMSKYKDEYDIQDAAAILEDELGRDPLFDIGDYTT